MKKHLSLLITIVFVCTFFFAGCDLSDLFSGNGGGDGNEVVEINVVKEPDKIEYESGERFEIEGMVVEAEYKDGTTQDIDDYTYAPTGKLSISNKAIQISYGGKTVQFPIQVTPVSAKYTPVKIKIVQNPDKTEYAAGQKFETAGMVVEAEYEDGTTREIKNYTYAPTGELAVSDTAISISYGGKSVQLPIQVNPVSGVKELVKIKVVQEPDKTEYESGQKFETAGMIVEAEYKDGTTQVINGYTYAPTRELAVSDTAISISYSGKSVQLPIQVNLAVYSTDYFSNDFDPSLCLFYDKFDGDTLDTTKWGFQTGNGSKYAGNGWGNSEQQSYKKENATVRDGNLVMLAKKETNDGKSYTSAKLVTAQAEDAQGRKSDVYKFSQTYGRFEAKIRLSHALPGMWPAFWMMPEKSEYGGWPRSGEIDIMEMAGAKPHESSSTVHIKGWASGWESYYHGNAYDFDNGADMTDWHVFGVEWSPTSMKFLVDGYVHYKYQDNFWYTYDSNGVKQNKPAPFDKDFFLILNLALGGNFGGGNAGGGELDNETVAALTNGGIEMQVDWVRAWELQNVPAAFANPQNHPTIYNAGLYSN